MKRRSSYSTLFKKRDQEFRKNNYTHKAAVKEIGTMFDSLENELESVLDKFNHSVSYNKNLKIMNIFITTILLTLIIFWL